MNSSSLISVLVRSKNDGKYIRRTLDGLLRSARGMAVEIICCDDASSDDTPSIIDSFAQVRRITRPDGEYRPGRTLNHMIRHCNGDIIVFNNADAIPLDDNYLRELTAPLVAGTADAVYGNQLPRPDAQWLVMKDNMRAFGDGSIAATWKFFFSLASSAVLRKDLLEHPFDETMRYSEDVEWAHRRPMRIAYAPNARVEHSHNYTIPELKKRFYGEGYADAQIYGSVPTLFRALAGAAKETLRDAAFLLRHPAGLGELFAAPVRRLIQKLYHRRGGLDYQKDHPTHA